MVVFGFSLVVMLVGGIDGVWTGSLASLAIGVIGLFGAIISTIMMCFLIYQRNSQMKNVVSDLQPYIDSLNEENYGVNLQLFISKDITYENDSTSAIVRQTPTLVIQYDMHLN